MQALVRVQLGDRELLELRHRLAHAGLDLLANASCGMDHLMLMMTDGVVSPIGPVAATSSDAFAESLGDLLAPVRAGGPHALVVGEPINQLLEVNVHGRFDQAGVDVGP